RPRWTANRRAVPLQPGGGRRHLVKLLRGPGAALFPRSPYVFCTVSRLAAGRLAPDPLSTLSKAPDEQGHPSNQGSLMDTLQSIKDRIPDYAKDLRLNLD